MNDEELQKERKHLEELRAVYNEQKPMAMKLLQSHAERCGLKDNCRHEAELKSIMIRHAHLKSEYDDRSRRLTERLNEERQVAVTPTDERSMFTEQAEKNLMDSIRNAARRDNRPDPLVKIGPEQTRSDIVSKKSDPRQIRHDEERSCGACGYSELIDLDPDGERVILRPLRYRHNVKGEPSSFFYLC